MENLVTFKSNKSKAQMQQFVCVQNTDLPFVDVLALDRVQKKLSIPDEAITRLRRSNLFEGRKHNFHVSAAIADATGNRADYIRTRALDDEHYLIEPLKDRREQMKKDILTYNFADVMATRKLEEWLRKMVVRS
jgi:hypothetical protein